MRQCPRALRVVPSVSRDIKTFCDFFLSAAKAYCGSFSLYSMPWRPAIKNRFLFERGVNGFALREKRGARMRNLLCLFPLKLRRVGRARGLHFSLKNERLATRKSHRDNCLGERCRLALLRARNIFGWTRRSKGLFGP